MECKVLNKRKEETTMVKAFGQCRKCYAAAGDSGQPLLLLRFHFTNQYQFYNVNVLYSCHKISYLTTTNRQLCVISRLIITSSSSFGTMCSILNGKMLCKVSNEQYRTCNPLDVFKNYNLTVLK